MHRSAAAREWVINVALWLVRDVWTETSESNAQPQLRRRSPFSVRFCLKRNSSALSFEHMLFKIPLETWIKKQADAEMCQSRKQGAMPGNAPRMPATEPAAPFLPSPTWASSPWGQRTIGDTQRTLPIVHKHEQRQVILKLPQTRCHQGAAPGMCTVLCVRSSEWNP